MGRFVFFCALAVLAGCGTNKRPALEDLSGREDLSLFSLATLRGARDGDRLNATAMFTDSSAMLTMDMRFAIGSPTTLESGTWKWTRHNRLATGAIGARSVDFLGGQDGPPSVGGVFDLLGEGGKPLYRVNLPVTQLMKP